MDPQHGLGDARTKEGLLKKVDTLLNQGYLDSDLCIQALINYFGIPKGLDDIRAVFDGTKSGLNRSLWAPPWFGLPTVDRMMHNLNLKVRLGSMQKQVGSLLQDLPQAWLHTTFVLLCYNEGPC